MNTARISHIFDLRQELLQEHNQLFHSDFTAIYVGGIETGRGLDQVINAIPGILKQIPRFQFLIIGSWGGKLEDLKHTVNRLGLTNHVILKGWIEPRDVPTYISLSDVGIIPHRINAHTLTTIPNKLFDYMALGKPVITSNIWPIRKIIENEKCGLIFNNSHDLIKAVVQLFSNRAAREQMGANGRNAILNKYNWESNANILLDVVDKLQLGSGPWPGRGRRLQPR